MDSVVRRSKPYLLQFGVNRFFLGSEPTLEEMDQAHGEAYQAALSMLWGVFYVHQPSDR